MTSTKFIITCVSLIYLAGCASHSTMRGSVAMKISDTEAHVCMGNNEVKIGDRINAFKNVCVRTPSAEQSTGQAAPCTKELVGTGMVTRLLNEHYSVVTFDKGVNFNEETVIEKL